ncbi:acyl-ACP--UDP-N-acetylglucosamine O-acyltransferase [Actinomadura kijaniata]|uniref:acyl-ACP--UDP-N-acetylglucosamine O-acyltransferase n=1 Tax=Actinomadura kijaniata TaxID=46161 RepID=UPI00082B824D|nr:acyl-ACP--UDP-N-acetylglucosamine O-acyltransferase [Actinomadura kijaniata]
MSDIHPSAVVSADAELDPSVSVGPFAVIEGPAVLGPRVHVHAHAVVRGPVLLETGVRIWPMAVVGGDPQDLAYGGEPTGLEIGARTVVREGATVHRATGDRPTRIGSDCLIMGNAHVAHDCRLGDRIVVSQGAGLAGHVEIADGAVIGGMAGVHQHVRIGAYAFVGGAAAVARDVLPFSMVDGHPARHRRVNTPGLRRAGIPEHRDRAVRAALRAARDGTLTGDESEAAKIMFDFLQGPSRRGLTDFAHPRRG